MASNATAGNFHLYFMTFARGLEDPPEWILGVRGGKERNRKLCCMDRILHVQIWIQPSDIKVFNILRGKPPHWENHFS